MSEKYGLFKRAMTRDDVINSIKMLPVVNEWTVEVGSSWNKTPWYEINEERKRLQDLLRDGLYHMGFVVEKFLFDGTEDGRLKKFNEIKIKHLSAELMSDKFDYVK